MSLVEAVLALIGLVGLVGVIARWYMQPPSPTPETDNAAPYREGLHAAVRIQQIAEDFERQIYAEAIRLCNETDPPETQATGHP